MIAAAKLSRGTWAGRPSVGQCTSSLNYAQIASNGTATATLTVTLLDAAGLPLAGITPTLTVSGTGNTVSAMSQSNAAGVSTGTIKSTVAEVKTLTVLASGVYLKNVPTLTATAAPAPALTYSSRDAGSTAGGVAIVLTGSNLTGATALAIGGTAATAFNVTNDTTMTATVPAHAAGVVDIVVTTPNGTGTLTGGFEYLPAPTTTYGSHDFEDGTLGGFDYTVSGLASVSVSAAKAHTGTKSVRCRSIVDAVDPTPGPAMLKKELTGNPMKSEANGVYMRWYSLWTQAAIDAVVGGQIKHHLCRDGGSDAWLMSGTGTAFIAGRLRHDRDRGIVILADAPNPLVAEVWDEIEYWNKRNGDGTGTVRIWVNGKLVHTGSHANYGSDNAAASYDAVFGIAYAAIFGVAGTNVDVYVDDAAIANGFLNPVT